jgi:hypothetical protein
MRILGFFDFLNKGMVIILCVTHFFKRKYTKKVLEKLSEIVPPTNVSKGNKLPKKRYLVVE